MTNYQKSTSVKNKWLRSSISWTDHQNTKETVAELKQQLDEMKSWSKDNFIPPTIPATSFPPLPHRPTFRVASSSSEAQRDPAYTSALKVLQSAKQILGFSPIKAEDIVYLKERSSIDDENELDRNTENNGSKEENLKSFG